MEQHQVGLIIGYPCSASEAATKASLIKSQTVVLPLAGLPISPKLAAAPSNFHLLANWADRLTALVRLSPGDSGQDATLFVPTADMASQQMAAVVDMPHLQ